MAPTTYYKIHEFVGYPQSPDGKHRKSCVQCGRPRSHWLHHLYNKYIKHKNEGEVNG